MQIHKHHASQNGFVQSKDGLWLPPQHLAHSPAPALRRKQALPAWIGLQGKSPWDWLSLLLVPLLIGLGTIWVIAQQTAAQNALSQQLHVSDQRQHASDQTIAQQARYDDLLKAYRDGIDSLLLIDNLRSAPIGSDVRRIARARTWDILQQVDTSRKTSVIGYLATLGLVQGGYTDSKEVWHWQEPLVSLSGANLSGANLGAVPLFGADLGGANLSGASLTLLFGAHLSGASLSGAFLNGADLERASLSGAFLNGADLSGADLMEADLMEADLIGANLDRASLLGADLSGTIMPDSTRHTCQPGEEHHCS